MPSLKKRVARQRDTLMARGPDLRLGVERIHNRLRHPIVLLPAFVAGRLVARAVPTLLVTLPRLTSQLRPVSAELRELDAFARLVAGLAPLVAGLVSALLSEQKQAGQAGSQAGQHSETG